MYISQRAPKEKILEHLKERLTVWERKELAAGAMYALASDYTRKDFNKHFQTYLKAALLGDGIEYVTMQKNDFNGSFNLMLWGGKIGYNDALSVYHVTDLKSFLFEAGRTFDQCQAYAKKLQADIESIDFILAAYDKTEQEIKKLNELVQCSSYLADYLPLLK